MGVSGFWGLGFAVNSRKLEHGLRMTRAGIFFSVPFGVWGSRCSNLLELFYCIALRV